MADYRRFVPSMHYTQRGRTTPPREGEPKIQFGFVGSLGCSGGSGVRDVDVDKGAMQTFRNLAARQQ